MKKYLNLIILILTISVNAQDYKFGKVSKEELQAEHSQIDQDANAEVLYKKENIYYRFDQENGFTQRREVETRIKIYNKDGLDYANRNLRLYNESGGKRTEITGIKGFTYNIDNNRIEETKLKKDGMFEEELNEYWRKVSFAFPNVKAGSVIELKYNLESPFISIEDVYVQDIIPIKKLDVKVSIPEYFNFKKTVNPRAAFYPKLVDSKKDRKETITSKSRTGWSVTTTTYNNSELRFFENVTVVNINNIPPLKEENFVDNLENYVSKITWEYMYYKSPRGQITDYSSNWDKVARTIYKSSNFGGQLDKTSYFEDDINSLLSGISNPMEKASKVLQFVKSKVKWNNYLGKYINTGVKKAYKEGSGNVAEINLMLTSMLRYAGLSANPVLVSTKDNGIPITPTLDGFNYVISAIEIPDGLLLLDATDPFCIPNVLSDRVMNWQGRLVRENGSSTWISLQQQKPSVDTKLINYELNLDNSIEGKVRSHYTLHYAQRMRKKDIKASDSETINFSNDSDFDIAVDNITIKNQNEIAKPYSKTFDFSSEDLIEEIGDKIYLSPLLFFTQEETPFKEETRSYPIDFVFPFTKKFMVNIKIPEGYTVESLPSNALYKLSEQDISDYKYTIQQKGNTIQLVIQYNFNYTFVPVDDYPAFREYYNMYIEKLSEKIVLKKV